MRKFGFLAIVFVGSIQPVYGEPSARTVEVTAEGISAGDAKEKALRKALEEGGEVFLSSRSEVANFELLRDAISTKAAGILRDVQVLEMQPVMGGTHRCRLKATVLVDALATEWADLQAILDATGNPRIIVTVREQIDGQEQESSIIESKIAGYLTKKGFTVLDAGQVQRIAERHGQRYDITSIQFMQWVARNQGAEVFINGSSSASFAGMADPVAGARLAMYNCNADISMYNTDNAVVIAREPIAQERGGARTDHAPSVEAGKQALGNASDKIFARLYAEAVKKWAASIGGPKEVLLEVRDLPGAGTGVRIATDLRAIDGVTSVQRQFDSGVGSFRITSKSSASVLTEHLAAGDWAKLIFIEEETPNVIRARYIGPKPD